MSIRTSEKIWLLLNSVGLGKYEYLSVAEVPHESERFVLIEYRQQSVWLPKKNITIEKTDDGMYIRIPVWLRRKMDRMAK